MTDDQSWQATRAALAQRMDQLRAQNICPTCYDLQNDSVLFGARYLVYEDALFKVALEQYPRMRGHTIVVFKPHRPDLSALAPAEAGRVFHLCTLLSRALKKALGAEKVYLNTMCDGPLNHLHLQLFPRYPGESIGSKRFVLPRTAISDGDKTARQVRVALAEIMERDGEW